LNAKLDLKVTVEAYPSPKNKISSVDRNPSGLVELIIRKVFCMAGSHRNRALSFIVDDLTLHDEMHYSSLTYKKHFFQSIA